MSNTFLLDVRAGHILFLLLNYQEKSYFMEQSLNLYGSHIFLPFKISFISRNSKLWLILPSSFLKSANVMLGFLYLYRCWVIRNSYTIILKYFSVLYLHNSTLDSSLCFFNNPQCIFSDVWQVTCQWTCKHWPLTCNMFLFFFFNVPLCKKTDGRTFTGKKKLFWASINYVLLSKFQILLW